MTTKNFSKTIGIILISLVLILFPIFSEAGPSRMDYKKTLETGVGQFLYNVMKGNTQLEDGLNALLWSKPDSPGREFDKNFTISQILDDVLIYNLWEWSDYDSKYITFTIIIPKKAKKLYLEGQILDAEFFEYVGNLTYETIIGAKKTVPIFKIIEIKNK